MIPFHMEDDAGVDCGLHTIFGLGRVEQKWEVSGGQFGCFGRMLTVFFFPPVRTRLVDHLGSFDAMMADIAVGQKRSSRMLSRLFQRRSHHRVAIAPDGLNYTTISV